MTAEQIRAFLIKAGWTRDSHGRYTKVMKMKSAEGVMDRVIRVVLNKNSITIEAKSAVNSWWFRIGGSLYEQITTDAEGVMHVLNHRFKPNVSA